MTHKPNTIQYIHNGSGKRNEKRANGRRNDRERKTMQSITYADDIVLMARSEVELKGMMKRFKKYIDKKGLNLSAGKSKVMVFDKERRRTKTREWKWGEEEIEEVKEINYLGYIMQKNGTEEIYSRKNEKSDGDDEADLEHRIKDISGQKKNKECLMH